MDSPLHLINSLVPVAPNLYRPDLLAVVEAEGFSSAVGRRPLPPFLLITQLPRLSLRDGFLERLQHVRPPQRPGSPTVGSLVHDVRSGRRISALWNVARSESGEPHRGSSRLRCPNADPRPDGAPLGELGSEGENGVAGTAVVRDGEREGSHGGCGEEHRCGSKDQNTAQSRRQQSPNGFETSDLTRARLWAPPVTSWTTNPTHRKPSPPNSRLRMISSSSTFIYQILDDSSSHSKNRCKYSYRV